MEAQKETSLSKTTAIEAHCHCKTHTYTFNIPNDQLPLKTCHCHCNMCRQTNGALFESYTSIPSSAYPYSDSSPPPATLKSFSCTPGAKRYFCSKCGTHLFFYGTEEGTWSINSGALTKLENDIHKYVYHIYVAEGPENDGFGLFNLLDDGLPRYAAGSETQEPMKSEDITSLLELADPSKSAVVDPTKRLPVSCYCGRVRALMSKPLAHPNNKWLKQFATKDKTKWEGSHCGCESCRLSTGAVVSSFVFPSAEHLEWLPSAEIGSGPEDEIDAGGQDDWRAKAGMTWWKSSDKVIRCFCGTCGAATLYEVLDRKGMEELGDQSWAKWGQGKDAVYDINIGLLRTSNKEGERLADWVVFEKKLNHAEDLDDYDGRLKEALEKGCKLAI